MPEKKVLKDPANPTEPEKYTPVGALLSRMYWMVLGHAAIILTAAYLATNKVHLFAYLLYFFFVACLIIVRRIDISIYKGQTGNGEPATMKHWRRFTLIVLGYSIFLLISVKLVAHFKLI